jgi:microcystin-dependent protein
MPRGPSGIYTLPPGYEAITGQTIQASQHNPPLEDIASALTGSLPRNGSAPMLGPINMGGSKITSLATGTAAADAVTKDQLDAAVAALTALIVTIPPGIIAPYSGDTTPSGWLVCNGAAISRTTYAALFAAIGTKYGPGDGSTTFNLPESRGEFWRFADLGRGVDPGRTNGSWQGQEIQSHSHGVNDPGHAHSATIGAVLIAQTPGNAWQAGPGSPNNISSVGIGINAAATGISIQATGGSETRPRNIAFIGIIKT